VRSEFPDGTTFYEWKQLPVARVPGPEGVVWMVCSEEPPRVLSVTAIREVRAEQIDEITFSRLRAAYLAAHRVAGF
jgi:hypothetical protein